MKIRAFIAIELSEDVKDALGSLQGRLRSKTPSRTVRWTNVESIHLTLQFLGDVEQSRTPGFERALNESCGGFAPIHVDVAGVGCFPNYSRPRIVWAGIEAEKALGRLQRAVVGTMEGFGFEPEKRPFTPHLTIGRVEKRASREDVAKLGRVVESMQVGIIESMTAAEVCFIKSDLRPGGAVYTRIFAVPLGG